MSLLGGIIDPSRECGTGFGKEVFEARAKRKVSGMTIQEAIKSGKPFRRPGKYMNGGDHIWMIRAVSKDSFLNYTAHAEQNVYECHVSPDDIVATDWEVKTEPREWFICEYENGAREVYDTDRSDWAKCKMGVSSFIRVREVL